MAVQFPSPAVDGQVYPDTSNGDTALENGRIYIYNGSKGIWELKPKEFTSSGGALEISALPKIQRHDSFERYESLIWNYAFENGKYYESAKGPHSTPVLQNLAHYWDGRWWAVFTLKEFDAEVYTSSDDGMTWEPFGRVSQAPTHDYDGLGSYTYSMHKVDCFLSNDDCLMILWQPTSSSSSWTLSRLKKGESEFTQLVRLTDLGFSSHPRMATCSNGKFYLIDSTKNLLRSIDNGDTWELTPMSLTNGTYYASYPYVKIHELPDGRLAMKWGIKPDGETQYSYHIIVSSDNGSTWESIDSDLDATYKYKSGTADRDKNDDNGNSAMWVTNGVVFNCVAFGNVDRNDGLEERMLLSHTTIYVLFYTTDIASGVWNYAGPAQSRCMNYGFYNPNDQRYFAVTDQGQIMCSSPGSLASDGWQWLDKAGFDGLAVQERARFDFTVLDERNNRLVFMYPGTYTFDYYTMEPAIKGLGEDNYANRLVTYKDLDNYLRAPFTDRTGQNLNKDVTKLAFGFTRQNGKGKNSVNLVNDQRNTLHRFYFVGSNHNDTAPKEGQVLASTKGTSSSNNYAPTVGRGGSGWIAVHRLDIYGNYVFQDYLNTGGVGYEPNEHAVAQSGALYFTGKTSYNGSENGYPYPYIIIPFTSWTYKRNCMWFGFTDSHIIWSARWHYNSTNYPQNWNDVKGNEYYLYDIVGFPLIQQNYGLSGHGCMSRKTRYNYNT